MAQSPAEIQKAYRERKKAAAQAAGDATYPFLKEPFYLWLERTDGGGDWTAADLELNLASIEMPQFEDDGGPRPNDGAFGDDIDKYYEGYERSIGRAEAMVDSLIGAASCIAAAINSYKREEIETRLKELEASDAADKATAMKAAVRLNKLLDQLDKRVRSDFPQWKVRGV
ncbi:MAG: hypothetical protein LC676_06940 [Loktanella sp.]|nr:hypothetical protein [Loktanella sp.]